MSVCTDFTHEPLAIIGMACRLPGADNLQQYWRLIVEGRSAVAEVPPERFDQTLYYDPQRGVRGKSYSKLAALLSNRQFDHAHCPIPTELLHSVDNTHLLMTGVAADALRHAGLDPFDLRPQNTAVFIGHAQGSSQLGELTYRAYLEEAVALLSETPEFLELPSDEQASIQHELIARISARLPAGRANVRHLYCNMVAGTIAKAFGLSGPWLALNSACASSLHAMLLGARALQLDRAEMVIVGGASDCKADSLVLFSQAQTLSTTNSRPFDAEADGLIMSEGYVALVMKTLDRALADGDPIQAVVRGLGLASDGRGKSLWAPRKEGQMKAMLRAYRSGVDMSTLQYLEAHATSTQVGDATELETLGEVLGPKFPPGKKIPVTSVKANIGHALEAAGVAGIIKTVLCMQHRTYPPAININSLNPKVDWESSPYYIPTTPAAWDPPAEGAPRRAAVNAFGIGGLNMHVVLDEFTESARELVSPGRSKHTESPEDRAVAVVGIGCVFPGAIGLARYWESLVAGRDSKTRPPAPRWTRKALAEQAQQPQPMVGGFITDFQYDWRKHKVPPKQVAEADPLQFMLLDAAEQALADAGYDRKPLDREKCGVVVGTEFGGDFCDHLEMGLRLPEMQHALAELLRAKGASEERIHKVNGNFAEVLLRKWPSLVDETGSFTSSTLASRITKTLDLAGGAVAIDSGSTSAMSGLSICVDMLLSGDNDLMICAAGQRRMGPNAFEALDVAGLLASGGPPRNLLDTAYAGIVPAEGVGVVVLKRLADARRDGDRIHAVIRGLGIAHHDSNAEALRLAAERSCAMAGVDPAEITLAELDTDERLAPSGDELQALNAAHGADHRQRPLVVGSSTVQFGHLGGAAGIVALIKASLEIEHAQSVPGLALQTPSHAVNGATNAVHAARGAEKLLGHRLASIACWSKGLACHLILEQGTPATPVQQPSNDTAQSAACRICRFGAAGPELLLAQLDAVGRDPQAAWHAAETSRFTADQRFRLAIVADCPDVLARKLKLARPQFQNPAARQVLEQQGIFYRETSAVRPRVAYVFPGQGSQYDGMLRQLVHDSPAAAQALSDVDATMARLGYPAFSKLAWETPTQLGRDIWTTQVSMLLADAIVLAALGELGIRPDLVLGHSYGEFPALLAAGAWNLETAIRMTRSRCEGIAALASNDCGMLATDAPPQIVERLCRGISGDLHLANLNAPDQTVIGGKRTHLELLAQALQAESHQARLLAVPAAFHTPLMAGASRLLEQELRTANLSQPTVSLVSTVSNATVRDAAEIRHNLADQLTTPVRYAELIARLATEQPTVFVEVGPQQTLTRLNRRILDANAAMIACDNPKRPGVEPLICVQALLECLGAFQSAAVAQQAMAAAAAESSQRVPSSSKVKDASQSGPMHDNIPHFDATERRRAKMRSGAGGNSGRWSNGNGQHTAAPVPAPAASSSPPPAAGTRLVIPAAPARPPQRNMATVPAPITSSVHAAPPKAPASPSPTNGSGPTHAFAPPARVASQAAPAAARSNPTPGTAPHLNGQAPPAAKELESFLINFVVEQTGYPPEVVDLDADLEADLGIDSIKKAQLFGELQEYFDIGATATNLSLDDFPTLRHVLSFLQNMQEPAAAAVSPVPPAPARVEPALVAAPASNDQAPVSAAASVAPARDAKELESFLINFVVEQTGYPPEVVDLDADLEADLGIDSIKKAQLFGELQEYFDVGASVANLSLDDFPTLRHVLDFLVQASSGAPPTAAPVETERVAMPVAPASQPPPAAAADATTTTTTTAARAGNAAELESFLINFVVEQTGYPPEVVDLDADLEADLGIDSIKKAQLFGELQEYFDVGAMATNLSLDDFPTLRHVLNFLMQAPPGPAETDGNQQGSQHTSATAEPAPAVADSNHSAPALHTGNGHRAAESAIVAKTCEATPYEIGWTRGQRDKQAILRSLRDGVECVAGDSSESHGQNQRALLDGLLSPDDFDELQGLADAVEVPLGNLLAHHASLLTPGRAARVDASARPVATEQPAIPGLPTSAVTNRFVLEMRDAPLTGDQAAAPAWSGAAIILGQNALAETLRLRLKQAGVETHILPLADDVAEVLAALDRICQTGPAPHLFITTGRDGLPNDLDDQRSWARRRHESMALPFFVCQKWVELASAGKWLDRATLVAATALGGDFGFERGAEVSSGGALTGLLKAIFIEYTIMQEQRNLRVKAIDAPAEAGADQLVDHIFRELASGNLDDEVAYVGDRRLVPFAVQRDVNAVHSASVRDGATWIVTGGARGITAACALELGRRFGLNLHLLGTSPAPQIDPAWRALDDAGRQQLKASVMIAARKAGQPAAGAWERVQKDLEIDRSLRAFDAAGVRATYHACDVSDRDALARTLDRIRHDDGPIEGILHGAGVDRSCRFERKQPDVVLQTIGAKVDGAAHLMALTRRDPIRHFVAFGSISGRLGSFGQTDYCLASDMLCKLVGAYRRQRPWVKAVGFHWHPWDEVGMAARPETKNVLQGKSDLRLMPLAEGIVHLLRELNAGAPAAEVLITERRHWERFAAGLGQLAENVATPSAKSTTLPESVSAEPSEPVELHTHRCQLKALVAPLPAGTPSPALDGTAWILGDNPAASRLAERLDALGCATRQIPIHAGVDQTLAELDRLWAEEPAKHLFIMTGRDAPAGNLLDGNTARQRRERGILLPFLVAQRWYKLLLGRPDLGAANLVAAVSLGGDFGFSGRAAVPDGGAMAGLLKALHIEESRRETSRVRAKVIDAPAGEPVENLVDAMLRELAASEPEVEVCWSNHVRRVIRPLTKSLPAHPAQDIPRGGTWVVTGGARGITAIAARELARRYGWKLHLIGKSPAPRADAPWRNDSQAEMKTFKMSLARQAVAEGRSPSEAWDRVMKDVEIFNNLRQFHDAGVQATYHACDISDRAALAAVLGQIRRQAGSINGILHGAGVIDPGRFENKRAAMVTSLIGAKFDGTLNLMALTEQDSLAFFIGFGSISGRFGGNGLTDYAAGNDALAKVIDWFRAARPECRAACIHWESWEGSGMATLPRYAWGPKSVMNMKYMLPEEGVRRLEQELEAGLPDSEVLYTFGDFYPMFYPHEQRPLGEFVPGALTHSAVETTQETTHELPLARNVHQDDGGVVAEVPLDPLADAFLVQHRLRGKPLLPVVVGLETLAEAAGAASRRQVVGFSNVQMLDGLMFHTDRPVTAQVRAVSQADGTIDCQLTCDFRNRAGGLMQKDRPYLRATVDVADGPLGLTADMPAAPDAWTDFAYPDDAPVYHGPAFRGVTGTSFDRRSGRGRIVSLPLEDLVGASRAAGWSIPSCVLDAAFYACGIHLWVHGGQAVSLPRAIDRLQLGRPARAGETCLVVFVCREIADRTACYDFTVVGEDRAVVVAAQGYRKVILARGGAQ